jgi:uncharacterized protein YmfQ (DUF2313 family)
MTGITPFEVGGTWLTSFSRASTGTYIGADGLLHTAAANVPRVDYSQGFGALLIEPAATNFVVSGQNSVSGFGSPVVTPNAAAAPDGTMTATQIVAEGEMFLAGGGITGAPASICCSVWLKSSVPITVTAITQGNAYPNGWSGTWNVTTQWQRFYVSGAQPSSVYGLGLALFAPNGSTLFVWGAQVEAGLVPTSTILTAGTAVTRAADIANIISPPQQSNLPAVPQRSAAQVLSYLLSLDVEGAVFPDQTDINSSWAKWLGPLAAEIARFEAQAVAMLPESNPGEATYLLADYQRVLGPDPYGRDLVALTLADQRALALSRWTQKFGVRPADFIAFAASFGVTITIQEYQLTTAGAFTGVDLVGHPVEFAWLVHLPSVTVEVAEASAASVGDLLGSYQPSLAQGAIAGRAPAHTNPYFTYA